MRDFAQLFGSPGDAVQAIAIDGCDRAVVGGENPWHQQCNLFIARLGAP